MTLLTLLSPPRGPGRYLRRHFTILPGLAGLMIGLGLGLGMNLGAGAAEPAVPEAPFFRQVSETHWSAGQISADQLAEFRSLGIRRIIALRPAEEAPLLEREAVAQGLRHHALPIHSAESLTPENVQTLERLLAEDPQMPTLLYCSSGNRVGALMALRAAWIDELPADEALALGRRYGLTRLEDAVREQLAAASASSASPPQP